jgi:hypothetical protein
MIYGVTTGDVTQASSVSRKGKIMTDTVTELDMSAAYSVASMPGVAFRITGQAQEETPESWELGCCDADCDHMTEWCYLYRPPELTGRDGMVRAIMVGDDREHIIDVAELAMLTDDDYCPGCGQTGCGH